ncbi:hypothetical protein [Jatrophihabitans sp. GAS493]|uniref:hypothetical protein n=1 Tax=Jatrophihabitans sp. GAS493 TaxID=1907575 RepID=UPI0012FDCCEB|nr:hypothetical protein [Jatrophihabitans sp. GAS493]
MRRSAATSAGEAPHSATGNGGSGVAVAARPSAYLSASASGSAISQHELRRSWAPQPGSPSFAGRSSAGDASQPRASDPARTLRRAPGGLPEALTAATISSAVGVAPTPRIAPTPTPDSVDGTAPNPAAARPTLRSLPAGSGLDPGAPARAAIASDAVTAQSQAAQSQAAQSQAQPPGPAATAVTAQPQPNPLPTVIGRYSLPGTFVRRGTGSANSTGFMVDRSIRRSVAIGGPISPATSIAGQPVSPGGRAVGSSGGSPVVGTGPNPATPTAVPPAGSLARPPSSAPATDPPSAATPTSAPTLTAEPAPTAAERSATGDGPDGRRPTAQRRGSPLAPASAPASASASARLLPQSRTLVTGSAAPVPFTPGLAIHRLPLSAIVPPHPNAPAPAGRPTPPTRPQSGADGASSDPVPSGTRAQPTTAPTAPDRAIPAGSVAIRRSRTPTPTPPPPAAGQTATSTSTASGELMVGGRPRLESAFAAPDVIRPSALPNATPAGIGRAPVPLTTPRTTGARTTEVEPTASSATTASPRPASATITRRSAVSTSRVPSALPATSPSPLRRIAAAGNPSAAGYTMAPPRISVRPPLPPAASAAPPIPDSARRPESASAPAAGPATSGSATAGAGHRDAGRPSLLESTASLFQGGGASGADALTSFLRRSTGSAATPPARPASPIARSSGPAQPRSGGGPMESAEPIRRFRDGSFGQSVIPESRLTSEDLDDLADLVVDRIERRVIAELERRGQYRIPGAY